ncbi:hypothetical protein D3C87_2068480 [compost metagenome]
MTGMPGEYDGRHCPDGKAQRLEREDGGAIADRAAYDMAGDDEDGTAGILHEIDFRLRWPVDRFFVAACQQGFTEE